MLSCKKIGQERYTKDVERKRYEKEADKPPMKRERLADIFRLIAQKLPAQNKFEAWKMLEEAFEEVEGAERGSRMYMRVLEAFKEIEHAGRKICVDEYSHHILLIGQNGSIEIRLRKDEVPQEGLPHPYADLKVILEKKGADGHFLWESPTS